MNILQFRIEYLDLAGDVVRHEIISVESRRIAHRRAQDRLLVMQQNRPEILAYRVKQMASDHDGNR